MKKMMTGLFISAITLGGLTFSQTIVHADTWKANTPEQIQITKDQKEYTLKNGDTLWAIGQKININVEALAKINRIDLAKGEEKNLPIGRVISFDGNKVTVKENDGSVVNQAVIKKEDKVDPKKPVGEPVADKTVVDKPVNEVKADDTQNQTPLPGGNEAVNGNDSSVPAETSGAPAVSPVTPAETSGEAQPAPAAPVETPAQPAVQPAPAPTPASAPQEEPHFETPEELHARMESEGWIKPPFPLDSSEFVDWTFDHGYDGYDELYGYIRPY
ncbi:LysM peptidoglycan-binding domain-containing protein [Enterococcus sp. DIV1420a]|uniref:LysM peptidoglycan-binding domain-containing protein n=1 Tax=Enterococcus sp. DIV1420a TaxID=2774672 RepID=UPI003F24A40A